MKDRGKGGGWLGRAGREGLRLQRSPEKVLASLMGSPHVKMAGLLVGSCVKRNDLALASLPSQSLESA